MTEDEQRLAAAELVIIELLPWIDRVALDDAAERIRALLDLPVSDDEAVVRLQALQLIADGRDRFSDFDLGGWVRKGRPDTR